MTPDEMARDLMERYYEWLHRYGQGSFGDGDFSESDRERLCTMIATAIAAERGACAEIARQQYEPFTPDGDWSGAGEGEKTARYIEQQIHARGQ